MSDLHELARDAQDARQAQIEVLAEDVLRDLGSYEDLLGRVAVDESAQRAALAMVALPVGRRGNSTLQFTEALRRAAVEKAREEWT